ncbi:hypothetical protein COSO111634_21215 [Corallococcus soli]
MVPVSKRSVLYVKLPCRPSGVSPRDSSSSNLETFVSTLKGLSDSPDAFSSDVGVFWKENSTWNKGARPRSRSGWISSTSFSKGRCWWAKARTEPSFTRWSSSRKVGFPSSQVRSASVLAKTPSRPSSWA